MLKKIYDAIEKCVRFFALNVVWGGMRAVSWVWGGLYRRMDDLGFCGRTCGLMVDWLA